MNANKQDAGGLPAPVWFNIRKGGHHLILFPAKGYSGVMLDPYMEMVKSAHDDVIDAEPLYTADQIRAYGEQCRAAAVASGEVDDLIVELENMGEQEYDAGCCNANYPIAAATRCMRDAAKLLRGLSRGVPEGDRAKEKQRDRESYSYHVQNEELARHVFREETRRIVEEQDAIAAQRKEG